MPKVKISEYSATANSNTDVASINIDEGCAPSGINNAIRAVMGHLKDFQQGTYGDPFNGPVNGTLGATTASTAVVTTLNSTDATDASSTTAAAMKTAGGLAVAKKMFVGLDANIYGLTVGRGAGAVSTNTAVGASALAGNSSGARVTAIGHRAGVVNTAGNNVFIGSFAADANTTGAFNAVLGDAALPANTSGSYNVACGQGSLNANTTASNNTAVGYQAGYSTTTGTNNVIMGYQAGYSNTTGAYNTFVGVSAGNGSNFNGNAFNTCIGFNSGTSLTTGIKNTFIGGGGGGIASGAVITTGSANTIVGNYNGNAGGLDIRTASNYIVLSDGDGNPRGIFDGNGNLLVGTTSGSARGLFTQDGTGASIQTGQTNTSFTGSAVNIRATRNTSNGTYNFISCTREGVADVLFVRDSGNVVNANNSYGAISDIKLKENISDATPKLDGLMQVRVVNYNFKNEPKHKQLGVIAQEIEQVFPAMVEETIDRDEEGNDLGTTTKSVKYSVFVPMLIKAIQEQQAIITSQAADIEALKAKVGL